MERELLNFSCLKFRDHYYLPLNLVKRENFDYWFRNKYLDAAKNYHGYEYRERCCNSASLFYIWKIIINEYVKVNNYFDYLVKFYYGNSSDMVRYFYSKKDFRGVNNVLKQLIKYKQRIIFSQNLFGCIFSHIEDKDLPNLKNIFNVDFMVKSIAPDVICRGNIELAEKMIDIVGVDSEKFMEIIWQTTPYSESLVELKKVVENTLKLSEMMKMKK